MTPSTYQLLLLLCFCLAPCAVGLWAWVGDNKRKGI